MNCFRRPRIHPSDKYLPVEADAKTDREMTEIFLDEELTCGTCNQKYKLKEHELVAYCAGCYQFLHCGIAGKCVGPNCKLFVRGKWLRQTWCVKCVPRYLNINLTQNHNLGSCLCQECYDDPSTPSKYKKK
jgi:RecJ-like exonuclease